MIVGPDDGYLGEIEALIKALQIEDKVLVWGSLYGVAKLEAYVDADVYVLPSRYEAFPMTVLEAMACRVPIILSEECRISEIVREKTGLIVYPSPAIIEKALLRILSDEKLRRLYIENCASTIKRFDISSIVAKLESLQRAIVILLPRVFVILLVFVPIHEAFQ